MKHKLNPVYARLQEQSDNSILGELNLSEEDKRILEEDNSARLDFMLETKNWADPKNLLSKRKVVSISDKFKNDKNFKSDTLEMFENILPFPEYFDKESTELHPSYICHKVKNDYEEDEVNLTESISVAVRFFNNAFERGLIHTGMYSEVLRVYLNDNRRSVIILMPATTTPISKLIPSSLELAK